MESINFTFNTRPLIRSWDAKMVEGLRDLIDTGIAYWCDWADGFAGSTSFPDLFVVKEGEVVEGFEVEQVHTISVHILALGINRILAGEIDINSDCIGNVAGFVARNDLHFLDGDDVDAIVQAGLYGRIVWG